MISIATLWMLCVWWFVADVIAVRLGLTKAIDWHGMYEVAVFTTVVSLLMHFQWV